MYLVCRTNLAQLHVPYCLRGRLTHLFVATVYLTDQVFVTDWFNSTFHLVPSIQGCQMSSLFVRCFFGCGHEILLLQLSVGENCYKSMTNVMKCMKVTEI